MIWVTKYKQPTPTAKPGRALQLRKLCVWKERSVCWGFPCICFILATPACTPHQNVRHIRISKNTSRKINGSEIETWQLHGELPQLASAPAASRALPLLSTRAGSYLTLPSPHPNTWARRGEKIGAIWGKKKAVWGHFPVPTGQRGWAPPLDPQQLWGAPRTSALPSRSPNASRAARRDFYPFFSLIFFYFRHQISPKHPQKINE